MNYNNTISIIGGAGHIGFPLALAFADKNFNVNLIDKNIHNLNKIKNGNEPFYEIGAKKILKKCLNKKKLFFSSSLKTIKNGKYIIICVGTPIDKNLKPQTKQFFNFFSYLFKHINKDQIVIIRSSVYPGIINRLFNKFKKINKNFSYCPERIVQSKALIELPVLPQIISGVSKKSVSESVSLFKKITKKIIITSIKEAELIKLYSNANRYINFAIANQLYIMCEQYNVSFYNVNKFMKLGYERNLNLPSAGFSAGPCLLKDTIQLSSFYKGQFNLGLAAMQVNQNNIIKLIIKKVKKIKSYKKKTIGVMGVAFKAETDDIRDSLSIKLIDLLKKLKLKIIFTDEYYTNNHSHNLNSFIKKSDIIILGAPHNKYKTIKIPSSKICIDIWNILKK